jgi:phospholipase/lecithinase/hemolysin
VPDAPTGPTGIRSTGSPSPIGTINTAFDAPPSPDALADYVAGNIGGSIETLRDLGFGSVAVLSPYDLANTALVVTDETRPLVQDYSLAVRDELTGLYTPEIDTYVLDMIAVLEDIQNDTDALGFDFLTGAENCAAGAAAALGAGATCIDLSAEEQDRYVFADFIHLTNATTEIIAAELAGVIDAGETVPAPIPLPASFVFLAGGTAGLRCLGHRRNRNAKATGPVTGDV